MDIAAANIIALLLIWSGVAWLAFIAFYGVVL